MKDNLERIELEAELQGMYISTEAEKILQTLIDEADFTNESELFDLLADAVADETMYYDDCFNYLRDTMTYDFKDAIAQGFGDTVTSIAYFYLYEEASEALYELINVVSDFKALGN